EQHLIQIEQLAEPDEVAALETELRIFDQRADARERLFHELRPALLEPRDGLDHLARAGGRTGDRDRDRERRAERDRFRTLAAHEPDAAAARSRRRVDPGGVTVKDAFPGVDRARELVRI